ncbi:hypothetical protein HBI56_073410 [Parastagonospora nodorum]|nr:hypothetical protein HBH56_171550 [Parastagonospora nodorum]KAH3928484.1 hypothetical protein HBH54_140110 [Parastagonospora nodorum]KAH3945436.1 hypothetical protein HBH53_145460 [Parastagonospora nodorum]KAH3984067.1 hypothetical protein HBH52_058760 [Parastagonospora nodorum]KAH3985634.1 hypothetical protein HBH51_017660 [Parastagonospora nodorum]
MLDFQDEHYDSALPMCLHMARNTLDAASAQLAAAYTRIIDVMLGCAPLEFIPAHSTHLTNANRGFFKSTPSVDDIIARSF